MLVEREKSQVAVSRLLWLAVLTIVSCTVGYFGQPLITENRDAVNTVVTVFSILAGFLIAVITFVTQPVIKGAKDWKELQLRKPEVKAKLWRHRILFYLYLSTLGMALALFLVPSSLEKLMFWLEVFFLSLATFVFLLSFTLPKSLMDLQLAQYEEELISRAPPAVKKLGSTKKD